MGFQPVPADIDRDKLIEFLLNLSMKLTEVMSVCWAGWSVTAPRVHAARAINSMQHDIAALVLQIVTDDEKPSLEELEGKIRKTAEDFPKMEADLTAAWNESLE
jgi:hypothetical protein